MEEQTIEEVVEGVASGTLKLLKIEDLVRMLNVSRSSIERFRKDKDFPRPKFVFSKSPRWTEAQIKNWLLIQTQRTGKGNGIE